MLPKCPLPQLIPQRLTELHHRLEKSLWEPSLGPISISMTDPVREFLRYEEAILQPLRHLTQFPVTWGPMWTQCWFRLELPKEAFTPGSYLFWDDEGEATLYADGLPWYGFDSAHHRAPLPTTPISLWIEGICCRTGIWNNDGRSLSDTGSVLRGASLWRRQENAWTVYWDFTILLNLLELEYKRHLRAEDDWDRSYGYHQPIFRVSPLFRRILRALDDFADAYDREGLAAAPLLQQIYRALPASPDSLQAVLTGHAHIDLVWLWPEKIGVSKAVHTFAIANRLLEMYPEFHFGYSQPASYEAVGQRSPLLLETVKNKIREGRWEATGGSDVESDTQLPCGEALARSFLFGQHAFAKLRGTPARTLWLPDVFGYSPCLPQILRQTGISWFFTTKLTWGTIHRFPYSSFRWQGHDGSEVLVHVSQEVGYNGSANLFDLRKQEECQQEAGLHNEFLVPTGFGDGGGGPTPEILERARRLADLCGLPRCTWGRIEDFFERMESLRDRLPVWQGELYLEYHRGVQTTHGDFKAAFRAAERALQLWEAAHTLARRGPIEEKAWRRVVFCQFHDAIPGSSIREVYEELIPQLEKICHTASETARAVLAAEAASAHTALFHPLPMPSRVIQGEGVIDLPPLSLVPLDQVRPTNDRVTTTSHSLANRRLQAVFNEAGEIDRLTIDGESIAFTGPGAQLWIYPDHPHRFHAWDIDRGTLGNGRRVTSPAASAVECATALRGVVCFTRPLTDKSSVRTRYLLEAESCVLRISWEIDWQDEETLLKTVFPTGYRGRMARFGAPFGSVLRPQQPGEPRTEAMFEVPFSRWLVLADDGENEGLALMTEAKYGCSVQSGTLGLSLLRSARITHTENHRRIRHLRNPCDFSDIGHWTIRAALGRYRNDLPRHEMPAALAEILFQPPLHLESARAVPLPCPVLQGGPSLIPVWTQPQTDGSFVLRLNETMGHRGRCRIVPAEKTHLEIVDLLGRPMPGVSLAEGLLEFQPYGLYGLRVSPA